MRALLLLVLASLLPVAPATACPEGAKCLSPGEGPDDGGGAGKWLRVTPREPEVEIGETLEPGKYRILFNTDYYGLPPVAGGWVYYRVGRDIFRVDRETREVLEKVTRQANRAF